MRPKDMTPGCKYIRTKPVDYTPRFSDTSFCEEPVTFVKISSNGSPVFKALEPHFCSVKARIVNNAGRVYTLPLEFDDDNWKPYESKTKLRFNLLKGKIERF